MVLSFSRKIFLHFYLNQRTENFLRGHEEAFKAFGGVPRVALYDNLKSCVLERAGDAVRFNPRILAFAAHYRYEARPVAVYRGNEKGRVERAIRYVRDNFFAARSFKDLADLNNQAKIWCEQTCDRPCPEDRSQSVRDVFEKEKKSLIALPDNPHPCDEIETVSIPKTPYARFDLNDYSVPHDQCRKSLTIHATLETVTILDGTNIKACHKRSYDKGAQVECEDHIATLMLRKKQARHHRGQDRLTHSIDCASAFLTAAAARGYSLRSTNKQLMDLLDDYGAQLLGIAMADALAKEVPHPNSVRQSLQRLLDEKQQAPTVTQSLSRESRANSVVIKPHSLNIYESLTQFELNTEAEILEEN